MGWSNTHISADLALYRPWRHIRFQAEEIARTEEHLEKLRQRANALGRAPP